MDRSFAGVNVLVTGSSRGIGLETARAFGLLGANVAINCSKSEEELSLAAARLKNEGISVLPVLGDVSVYSECERLFQEFNRRFGAVDILVNNAGISSYGLFTDMTPAEWERLTEINLYSVYNCCHIAVCGMVARKKGRIINISSVWGEHGASCEAVYSGSKGGVNAFTKALAKELAPSGIYVNAIACGFIDTKMNEGFSPAEREEIRKSVQMMKLGRPADVAGLCVYLAEAEYMTGKVIELDGGGF